MSLLKKTLRWFSYWICRLGRIMELQGQKYAWTRFPSVDQSAIIGAKVIYHGPKTSIQIGAQTYINDAVMVAGDRSKIVIGKNCALGYRVSIKAVTHDLRHPTPSKNQAILTEEKDIIIGDNCWIGDNVFIKEGVTLGDHVIVGANSVVTKSFPDHMIIAGAPAKVIRPLNHP